MCVQGKSVGSALREGLDWTVMNCKGDNPMGSATSCDHIHIMYVYVLCFL